MIPKTPQELDQVLSRMQKNGAPKDIMQKVVDAYKVQKTKLASDSPTVSMVNDITIGALQEAKTNPPSTTPTLDMVKNIAQPAVEAVKLEQLKQTSPTVGMVSEQIQSAQQAEQQTAIEEEMKLKRAEEKQKIDSGVEDMGFFEKLVTSPSRGAEKGQAIAEQDVSVLKNALSKSTDPAEQKYLQRQIEKGSSSWEKFAGAVTETGTTVAEGIWDVLKKVPFPLPGLGDTEDKTGVSKALDWYFTSPEEFINSIKDNTPEPVKDFTVQQLAKVADLYQKLPVEWQQEVDKAGLVGGFLATVLPAASLAKTTGGILKPVIQKGFQKLAPKVEAVIEETAKDLAPAMKVTIKEQFAGLRPDIKNRISGKPEKLKEYFDIAKARNFDDVAPSPLAHASEKVIEVRNILNKELNDVGSEIGKFRKKIETIKAEPEDIQSVIQAFDDEVTKKGLIIGKNNKLQLGKSRETVFSNGEMQKLQEMRDMLIRLKGDPKLSRIIDNRNIIQKNVEFGKASREISGELDSVAKSVRAKLKGINEKILGKTEAGKLEEYGDLIGLVDDLNGLTSKGQNAEFLLKRVLSERDRMPKELLKSILDRTGIDLMDEAQMAQIATEILGNPQQKGLFRQEVTKAGLDAVSLLTGNPIGAATSLLKTGIEKVVTPEKVFMEAAKKGVKRTPTI